MEKKIVEKMRKSQFLNLAFKPGRPLATPIAKPTKEARIVAWLVRGKQLGVDDGDVQPHLHLDGNVADHHQ
jgi:hypothetical protein